MKTSNQVVPMLTKEQRKFIENFSKVSGVPVAKIIQFELQERKGA